jgi:hypothetical protein
MDIKKEIQEKAQEYDWDVHKQLELALEFIEDTDNSEAFSEFLQYATE